MFYLSSRHLSLKFNYFEIIIFEENFPMKSNMKFVHGMAGLLSVSALAVGFASDAYAFHIASDVGFGISTYTSSDGGTGVFAPGSAVNITYSRHNLGTTNKLGSNHTVGSSGGGPNGTSVLDSGGNVVGTNQICVFCHTPHGFNAAQAGPLWNKAVNTSTTYSVYNSGSNKSSTFDAATPSIGSVSLACLSCHDGTQAMDNMINGAGSGLMAEGQYDGAASSINASKFYISNGGGESQAYTWGDTAGGFAQMSQGSPYATGSFINSDSPALEGILLGTDLSNDHPISMQYCGGGISSYLNSNVTGSTVAVARGTCNDRLFNLPTVGSVDASGGMRFWVDTNVIADSDAIAAGSASTGGTGANPITRDPDTVELYVTDGVTQASSTVTISQDIAYEGGTANVTTCGNGNNGDACGRGFVSSTSTSSFAPVPGAGIRTKQDIMLFTNNAGVSGDGGPSVECASCHDPHTPNNGTFLRVSNQGSGLCLSCHVK
jgi:predicted CXXCH cytochrome family protein